MKGISVPHPRKYCSPLLRRRDLLDDSFIFYQALPLASALRCLSAAAHIEPMRSRAVSRVFCTENFLFATSVRRQLDDYLRPVDAILVFPNGNVLLLSEREADGVLRVLANGDGSIVPRPMLVHLSYTGSGADHEPVRFARNPLMRAAAISRTVGETTLVAIWLFGGRTSIPVCSREVVKRQVKGAVLAVRHLVAMQGQSHMLPRSDLERLLT